MSQSEVFYRREHLYISGISKRMVKKEGAEVVVSPHMIADEPEEFEDEIFDGLDSLSEE